MWLPTRPYSLIDAINRVWLATGSMRNVAIGSDADYNGHYVSVAFNTYRQYWVAEYFWAGRIVVGRGSFENCIIAAKAEFDRGALGATVVVTGVEDDKVEWMTTLGFVPYSPDIAAAHFTSFSDLRYAEINSAMTFERQLGCPAVGLLANSATIDEYNAKADAFFAERKARNQKQLATV